MGTSSESTDFGSINAIKPFGNRFLAVNHSDSFCYGGTLNDNKFLLMLSVMLCVSRTGVANAT